MFGFRLPGTAALALLLAACSDANAPKIYVASWLSHTIKTYNAAGVQTTPTITGLRCASALAVDASGKIYVANGCDGTVTAYTPAGEKTAPTITGLGTPQGIAVDAAGKIYVFNFDNNTVTTYTAAGVKTSPTITWLSGLLAVDASG